MLEPVISPSTNTTVKRLVGNPPIFCFKTLIIRPVPSFLAICVVAYAIVRANFCVLPQMWPALSRLRTWIGSPLSAQLPASMPANIHQICTFSEKPKNHKTSQANNYVYPTIG